MLFDIDEVLRTGAVEKTAQLDCDSIASENVQVKDIDKVEVQLRAFADGDVCITNSHVQTTVRYICSRCLSQFKEPLATDFQELFTRTQAAADEAEEIHFVKQGEVLLDPYVEQAINLVLKLKPLCTSDCKGLCPECGTNLNEHTCNCTVETIDPRLEVLKGLLSGDESE
ncbi:DUF177 domain-containing protein [Alicyclobacillus sp. SO9]|uniref:YceD family protein n=1 Tax=Alicyclobacillus sp. SO9 TaxID=2665646 RepID=UPI0018E8DDF8|nr:YceD family protein [Alicyclobacillus sp. SO9]QQE80757.1 DUF177 domain-containing protein [Alicyclobacillus sp. SO9]